MRVFIRPYEAGRDRDAVLRIWDEIGWIGDDDREGAHTYFEAGDAFVAELNGEAECLAAGVPGSVRHLDREIPFGCVTAVTTGRVARKQGLASRTCAHLVARLAENGAALVGLGAFELGFYNQLGFGNGAYYRRVRFDPADLLVKARHRPPTRILPSDSEAAHRARLGRMRSHGGANLHPHAITASEMRPHGKRFGLGYKDEDGEITHMLWCWVDNAEFGPYGIAFLAYHTYDQLMELLSVIRSLGDQVRRVTLLEPPGIQMQDLLRHPFTKQQLTEGGRFHGLVHANAYWQMRIANIEDCIARTRIPGEDVRFNLILADPIEMFLAPDTPWRGVAGSYVVTLGPESHAERGQAAGLPVLEASVGAFTRLWLGVRPPAGLAATDDLRASPGLIAGLERVLRLPEPHPDWDF